MFALRLDLLISQDGKPQTRSYKAGQPITRHSVLQATMMKTGSARLLILVMVVQWTAATFFGGNNANRCQTFQCQNNYGTAQACCNSGQNRQCCSFTGPNYGSDKPGVCPNYNGRR